MSGKKSRDKGARFERKIAEMFSFSSGLNLRRTPMLLHINSIDTIGNNRIKSDIYCVDKEINFRFFIECKYRECFTLGNLIDGESPLFRIYEDTVNLWDSLDNGYTVPLLIFKGGDFKNEMVMFTPALLPKNIKTDYLFLIMMKDEIILLLEDFLNALSPADFIYNEKTRLPVVT